MGMNRVWCVGCVMKCVYTIIYATCVGGCVPFMKKQPAVRMILHHHTVHGEATCGRYDFTSSQSSRIEQQKSTRNGLILRPLTRPVYLHHPPLLFSLPWLYRNRCVQRGVLHYYYCGARTRCSKSPTVFRFFLTATECD